MRKPKITPAKDTKGYAIAIIDMQSWFLDDKGQMGDGKYRHQSKLINNCAKLIRWGMKNKLPIVFLTYEIEHDFDEAVEPEFNQTVDELWSLCRGYKKMMKMYKRTDSGANELVQLLSGVRNFYLAGVNASACVGRTSSGLVDFGRNAYIVDECCVDTWDRRWVTAGQIFDGSREHFFIENTPTALPMKKLIA